MSKPKEILLLGSGPGAERTAVRASHMPVACVNASSDLLCGDTPDYYLIGERPAAISYYANVIRFGNAGCKVFMRPHAYDQLVQDYTAARKASKGMPPLPEFVTLIDLEFGPAELREHHKDHPVEHDHTRPGPRPRNTWMSSGVLMLWVLLELERPEVVYMDGFTGYPSVPAPDVPQFRPVQGWVQGPDRIPNEYAPGLPAQPDRPMRLEVWSKAMNARMAQVLGALSRYYTDTRIVMPHRPAHARDDWRVEYEAD